MNRIKFSHNWNQKLSNDVFTTIRRWTPEKYSYYEGAMRGLFEVELNGEKYSEAILWNVTTREFKDIQSEVLRLDTGMVKREEIDKLFKQFGIGESDTCIILTFMKSEVENNESIQRTTKIEG